MRNFCALLLPVVSVLMLLPAARGAVYVPTDTRDAMKHFSDEIGTVWTKYTLPQQRVVREQIVNDLNSTFSKDVNRLSAPAGTTLKNAFDYYLTNVVKAIDMFPLEKMKNERTIYVRCCQQCFRQEIRVAEDFKAERTIQDCYDMMLKFMEDARDRLTQEKYKDVRTDAFSAMSQFFNDVVVIATVPADLDISKNLDDNVRLARTKFPREGNKKLEEINSNAYTMMENAAKRVQQRAKQERDRLVDLEIRKREDAKRDEARRKEQEAKAAKQPEPKK